jgi:DNA-binding transcriptional ArsR family regulator
MTDKYKILKALSNEHRFKIVELLNQGERAVWGLLIDVKVSPQIISKHLSILKDAGIVDSEKSGTEVFYKLKTETLVFMGKWFIQF